MTWNPVRGRGVPADRREELARLAEDAADESDAGATLDDDLGEDVVNDAFGDDDERGEAG
jgi:hypothetical protein